MCYTSQTEAYFQSRESWSSSGAPEFQKSWWGQAYVVGKISPPPLNIWMGLTNLYQKMVRISPRVPKRSGDHA